MTSVALAGAILTLLSLFTLRTPISPYRRAGSVDAPAISNPPDTTQSSRPSAASESFGPKKLINLAKPNICSFPPDPLDHVPARYIPESRTVYDYPLYMFTDPQKNEGGREKRTTLILNFSPKSSGLSLDTHSLSVN